jgi:ureidoacrylate peracid hydrolase
MHKIALPDWLFAPERFNQTFDQLDLATTALIVVDLQNFFMEPGSPLEIAEAREVVPNVNRLITATRSAGGLVVFLQHTFDDAGPRPMPAWQYKDAAMRQILATGLAAGSQGHSLFPSLDVQKDDLKVNKYRPSAFVPGSSDLHERLRARNIETLIITGCVTNVCCESTARDAQMMDYRVLFVSDGTATANDELHNATLLTLQFYFAEVVPTQVVLGRIEQGDSRAQRGVAGRVLMGRRNS